MLYREAGQFKTSYAEDMQVFPIRQDRIALWLLLIAAFIGVPLLAKFHVWPFGSEYLIRAILIPFLILSLAAVGLNILTGYCGQLSLGSGAFMAVGAYCAYKFGTGVEIMALFQRLHDQGNTIVLVTHEHDIALHAHRIIHIRDGKVERDEPVAK